MTQQRKERGDGEGFVTVGDDLEVYSMPIVPEREERGGGINRYHEQDSYDANEV